MGAITRATQGYNLVGDSENDLICVQHAKKLHNNDFHTRVVGGGSVAIVFLFFSFLPLLFYGKGEAGGECGGYAVVLG